jgi:glycosyltransferase involved in cell wall biosynthesis
MSKNIYLSKKGIRFLFRILVDLRDVFTASAVEPAEQTGQKILIFNWRDTKHAYAGGAEVYIHELAKRWVENGNQVTLFCGSDGKSKRNEIVDGVRIVRRGGFYFVYIWAFIYYMVKFRGKYDVIVDCENGIPFFTPIYTRKKTFLVIHHVHQEVFRTSLKKPFAQLAMFLEMKLMPYVYRNIQVITVSESSRKEIIEHGITETDPVVIYNGIDNDYFKPARKSPVPLIVYVGRLKAYKNISVLLRAVKRIRSAIPELQVVIAGDGEDMSTLKRLTKKLGLSETVTFTGKVSDEEKVALFQLAWVFVNPSLREGWGITTIEANACGTPVVASDVPGLRDSVRNPHTGFLVPFGDDRAFAAKMKLILTDRKLRRTLSLGAVNWAKQFSWEYSARQFARLMASSTGTEQVMTPALKNLRPSGVAYGEVERYEK